MKRFFFVVICIFITLNLVHAVSSMEFIETAKWGNAEKVKMMLDKNPELVKATDNGIGATALHWAAIYGRKDVVKVILGYKPDVNAQEKHNGTTLHWAAHCNDSEVAGWLIEHGAKVDHVNRFGRTPLLVAARRGCLEVVKLLLKKGANINTTLNNGNTVLHIAARNGHSQVVEYLLSKGAKPDVINKNGYSYKDIFYERPKTIEIDPKVIHQCIGLYKANEKLPLLFQEEDGHLYFYTYGKDELLPIGDHKFITSSELNLFTFVQNSEGEVDEVIFYMGDKEVKAQKFKAPASK